MAAGSSLTVFGGCGGANPPADELWARVNGTTSFDVSASQCTAPPSTPAASATARPGCAELHHRYAEIGCRTASSSPPPPTAPASSSPPPSSSSTATPTRPTTSTPATSPPATRPRRPEKPIPVLRSGRSPSPKPAPPKSRTSSPPPKTARRSCSPPKGSSPPTKTPSKNRRSPATTTSTSGIRTPPTPPARRPSSAGSTPTTIYGNLDAAPQATPDGRYVVFTTANQLVETDTDHARDVYRFDAETGELIRVSTNVFGVGGNGPLRCRNLGSRTSEHHPNPTAISDDGQKIVFTTAEALSPARRQRRTRRLPLDARPASPSSPPDPSGFAPRETALGGFGP